MAKVATASETKRLIYFKGHARHKDSTLITRVCKNYETISALLEGESATRTLANLYNLYAVRGPINVKGELILEASMSGPHHYFGSIDPRKHHTIEFRDGPNKHPTYIEWSAAPKMVSQPKAKPNRSHVISLRNYKWLRGRDGTTSEDSLFRNPGVLEIDGDALHFPVIHNAYNYDLTDFKAAIVPNNRPFAFNQELIAKYKHAQHPLRVITYNYGPRYVDDYLMKGSGIFIERHDFIQAITPMNAECSGFVILGKEIDGALELVAVAVPFGYTCVVDAGAIHGDSTLTGMYMMAMTGNHEAMNTADSVFIKNRNGKNVAVRAAPAGPVNEGVGSKTCVPGIAGEASADLLISSNHKTARDIIACDRREKNDIAASLNALQRLYWNPVILTCKWAKTHGINLPLCRVKN